MTTLKATLHKQWFDAIAAGIKTEEYREIKPYWTKRLEKSYDFVQFRNGYRSDAPVMTVEYHGFTIKMILHPITNKMETVYALKLGRVLWTKNYDGRSFFPSSKRKYEQVFKKNGEKNMSTH